MSAAPNPLAVFGDETSIGLALAFLHKDRARAVACKFEVNDVEASRDVAAHLGLDNVEVLGRTESNAHLQEMRAALPPLIAAGATFVLTGKASTIQDIRQSLKRHAVPATRIAAKAYWAPGKTGLD